MGASSDPQFTSLRDAAYRSIAQYVAAHQKNEQGVADPIYRNFLNTTEKVDALWSATSPSQKDWKQLETLWESLNEDLGLNRWQKFKIWATTWKYSGAEKYFQGIIKIIQFITDKEFFSELNSELLNKLAKEILGEDTHALTALFRHPKFNAKEFLSGIQVQTLEQEQVQRLLQAASASGRQEIVKVLLKEHPNCALEESFRAACEHGHIPVIGLFIRAPGAKIPSYDFMEGFRILARGEPRGEIQFADITAACEYYKQNFPEKTTFDFSELLQIALRGGWPKKMVSPVMREILNLATPDGIGMTLVRAAQKKDEALVEKLCSDLISIGQSKELFQVADGFYGRALLEACRNNDTWTAYHLSKALKEGNLLKGIANEVIPALKKEGIFETRLPRIQEFLDGHVKRPT